MNKTYLYIGIGVVVVLIIGSFFFFRSSSTPTLNTQSGSGFGVGQDRQVTAAAPSTQNGSDQPITSQVVSNSPSAKIFEINAGPVAGATLIDEGEPTTTVARFVMQDSGHVFDLPLDSPGAVARSVSNTTIPGIATTVWSEGGSGLIA